MVKLIIQRYTREAGVRNLERSLAALARAAAVRVAEQEPTVPLNKDVHQISSPLLESRLAEGGAEVEMEVMPMDVNNHEISNVFRIMSPLIVDEDMLEKVLGVSHFYIHIYRVRFRRKRQKREKTEEHPVSPPSGRYAQVHTGNL